MKINSILAILLLMSGCDNNAVNQTKITSEQEKQAKIILCDAAKGAAISTCLNMQTGAAGMSNCNASVNQANSACERSDLTIMNILEDAANEVARQAGKNK
jgi:hypothetical protein